MSKLVTIQGCPVHNDIAPYIFIILYDARAHVNSIYRGADAEKLLNAHHKLSQRQLYEGWVQRRLGFLPANPPGFSTHELRSDGVAYPHIPRGHRLDWWMQGFDVDDSEVPRVKQAAREHGWALFQPYPSGAEYHHLNFVRKPPRPRVGSRDWFRLVRLRATLPRH